MSHIKKNILFVLSFLFTACGFHAINKTDTTTTFVPIAAATINMQSSNNLTKYRPFKRPWWMGVQYAYADAAQGSAIINVTYNNPSSTLFTVNTNALGNNMMVNGDELNMGSITVSGLDDNTLKMCPGAPSNKCNRLYIRVFTLGTASGGITNITGFINTTDAYGLDVFAGSVATPLGFNSSATASSITNAAVIYTYNISNSMNRVRLTNLSIPAIPIKASLANAGSGSYEMNLVVQYALGYQ